MFYIIASKDKKGQLKPFYDKRGRLLCFSTKTSAVIYRNTYIPYEKIYPITIEEIE